MDDEQQREVARGLRAGESEAWRTLYDAYAQRVWHAVARRMGGDSADVGDVVQETFLAAARSAGSYDATRGSLWLWLSGIARRHVALHYRKRGRRRRLEEESHRRAADNTRVARWLEGQEDIPGDALASAELAEPAARRLRDAADGQVSRRDPRGSACRGPQVLVHGGPLQAGPCPAGVSPGVSPRLEYFAP
jgi:RNA polymerase sigma-70 factor (ECF subfamily)